MTAPARELLTTRGSARLEGAPWLMGIVNASPDSFSDGGVRRTLEQQVALAEEMVAAGAQVIDIGGESGVTNRPAVSPAAELERVLPLVARVAALDVIVSVDTYKPEVAMGAIAVGAAIVNDVSGLRDPELADVCAATGAGLVLMHTRAAPKQKLVDPELDGRVAADIQRFLREKIELARERGVSVEQLIVDPGPDFGKTPSQTVEALRALPELHDLGRPILLAVSRKDFVGAITGRPPRSRLAGTLAAVEHGLEAGVHILRIHDVAEVSDFIAVRSVLDGETGVESEVRLADALRWEQEG